MKFLAALAIAYLSFFGRIANADDASFNKAIALYLRGFQDCIDANALKIQDLSAAKTKYENYLKIKEEAVAMDASILSTAEHDMAKNIDHCEKVKENLAKAEAAQIIDAAFVNCEKAQQALEENDLNTSRINLQAYQDAKNKAFQLTDKANDNFQASSKIKTCAKTEKKLFDAENRQAQLVSAVENAHAKLNSYTAACNKAYTENSSASFDALDSLKTNFEPLKKNKAAAFSTLDSLQHDFGTAYSKQSQLETKTLKAQADECERKSIALINRLDAEKKSAEKELVDITQLFEKALEQCKSAKRLLETEQDESVLPRAKLQYSASLTNKTEAEKAEKNLAGKYPKWNRIQVIPELSSQLQSCNQTTAAAISKKEKSLALLKKQDELKLKASASNNAATTQTTTEPLSATPLNQDKNTITDAKPTTPSAEQTEKPQQNTASTETTAEKAVIHTDNNANSQTIQHKSAENNDETKQNGLISPEKSWKELAECRRKQIFPCN